MFIEAIDELTLAIEDSHRADRRVRAAKAAAHEAMCRAKVERVWHRGLLMTRCYGGVEILTAPAAHEIADPGNDGPDDNGAAGG